MWAGSIGNLRSLTKRSKINDCRFCNAELSKPHLFCPECGHSAKAPRYCRNCHRDLFLFGARPKHCGECGWKIPRT